MSKYILFIFLALLVLALPASASAQVEINEFVSDASPEWVEFFNTTDSAEYIKTYYLDDDTNFSDDSGSSPKKLLSALNTSNFQYPFIDLSSFINNSGDSVVLFNPSGEIVDQYTFSSNPGAGVSIGRSPDHTGGFTILSSNTKGTENSAPSTPTPTPTPSSTPTSTPIPTPTATPTATPKPSPTKTPTPKVNASPSALAESSGSNRGDQNSVLGQREGLEPTPSPEPEAESKPFPILGVVIAIVGLGCLGFGGYHFWKTRREDIIKS